MTVILLREPILVRPPMHRYQVAEDVAVVVAAAAAVDADHDRR